MTRSFFRGLTLRAVICVVLSMTFLLSCLWYNRRVNRSREQDEYREEYGSLLMASEYRELKTDVLKNHKDVQAVYSAYDESGKLLGYIVDVKTQTASGYVHSQMSISDSGENLLNIRIIEETEDGPRFSEEDMDVMREQLKGARIPVAIRQDLPVDVPYQVDYDPLLGLHDGVYYARNEKPSKDGYTDYCEIEVSGGRIVRVKWDAENETNNTRSADSISGEYKVSGNIWADQAYRLENHLVHVQDPVKLAMKSDGKTEIIDGVTIDISTFVKLVNSCIDYSRSTYTKEMYLRDHSSEGEKKDTDKKETGDTDPTSDPATTDPTAVGVTATPSPTKAPSQVEVIGGEDGMVSGDGANVLSESVDGIPMSEIRTYIDGLADDRSRSAALLTTVNQAYKFIREYLNWVG
jgi:Major membrane immunogen, membrane-anchored lipoprotein